MGQSIHSLALPLACGIGCWGQASDGESGAAPSALSPEPELLAELGSLATGLRQTSSHLWWLRDGQIERIAKSGGEIEQVAGAHVFAVSEASVFAVPASWKAVIEYTWDGEPLSEVSLAGRDAPYSCDALEARGSQLFCANGLGVFQSTAGAAWQQVGTSQEFGASGQVIAASHLGGLDLLGERVFFGSSTPEGEGVLEYSESAGLVPHLPSLTRDVTAVDGRLYALAFDGIVHWTDFDSEAQLPLESRVDDIEADATYLYYVEIPVANAFGEFESRIMRRAHQ